jgi:CubicO group peptidase (beta-lactamase class C family)
MFTPFGGFGYGYGWGIGKDGDRPVASHVGGVQGFSSSIARYPNDKVVIIVLGNREDVNSGTIGVQLAKMVFGEK